MDPISIIASALTIGASAAQLSLALFSVVQTLKNAPEEIAEIANEISLLGGSLQSLGEILDAHRNLCKPAIFNNTSSIISRYEQVAAEIRLLINKPRSLARLTWPLKKRKAKGLLKKVEGIKSLLILELNVIRLAREEVVRPYPDFETNGQTQSGPRFNRFRRTVESAVQANRQVVESAQQEEEKLAADAQRYTSAEIDVWKSGSSDTATWLYHLVFSSTDTSPPPPYPPPRRLHQASVADESAETTARNGHSSSSEAATAPGEQSSASNEKAMILWSSQTEPGLVVDRLLSSWTTLSPNQISLSSTRHHGVEGVEDDEWREDIVRMVEEANKDEDLSFGQWEQQNEPVGSDDEAFQSAEEDSTIGGNLPAYNFRSNAQSARQRNAKTSDRTDSWSVTYESSPTYNEPPEPRRNPNEQHVRWRKTPPPISRPRSLPPKEGRHTKKPRPADAGYRRPPSRVHRIHSDQTGSVDPSADYHKNTPAFDTRGVTYAGYINPFAPSHIPPPVRHGYMPPPPVPLYQQEMPTPAHTLYDSYWPYPPPPPSPPPASAPCPPSHVPSSPAPPVDVLPTVSDNETKEKAVLAAVEKLLQKHNQEPQVEYKDPAFTRLAQIWQEREVQSERERANATTEAYIKQMQDAHEKDEEKLKQLEYLLADQRIEQRRMEIIWEEERKTMELKAVRQTQEVKDLAAKEVAAAQLAKEAAQLALNVEKLDAEKEARRKADAMVVEERKKAEDGHKSQLQRYEELIRGLQEQQLNLEQDVDRPIRRTRIAEGNRSVDVTEYATSKRASPLNSSSSPLHDSFARLHMGPNGSTNHSWSQRSSRHDSFRSSLASLQSSRTSLGSTSTAKSQQMIVLPVKTDRQSQRIAELKSSLAGFGIESVFEDSEESQPFHMCQILPYTYDDMSDQIVRSTIFWEASALSLGSELLLTMRQAGWRPTYTRISGKGQTHYLGSQPVHTYFFNPGYKPQFCPSTKPSAEESITIQKALVEEYALIELGFQFQTNDMGMYILDGRLSYNDIEALIERSFLIRENNYRRIHRQLQWHFDKNPEVLLSAYPETYAPSQRSASSVYSVDNSTVCDKTDTETQDKKSSSGSDADQSEVGDVNNFLVPCARRSGRSVAPSSVASRTSRSANPYRKYMKTTEDTGSDSASRSFGSDSLID